MPDPVHPANKSWIVSIHRSADDAVPIGTGVVIRSDQVLTCAHVLRSQDGEPLTEAWVSFPMSQTYFLDRLRSVRIEQCPLDAALIHLSGPAPTTVRSASLRSATDDELSGKRWWSFGFPDEHGSLTDGVVAGGLAAGTLLLSTNSQTKSKLVKGFSGGPLWSPDYQAVVGIVTRANSDGDGHALALRWIDQAAPRFGIGPLTGWKAADADEAALAAWGWVLREDPQLGRHWSPRARGVAVEGEAGHRFRGRKAALRKVIDWLDQSEPDRRVMVVTGSPGVGKSAVLGRIVTTADTEIRKELPSDDGVLATEGSVDCAVHVKGKTALEVAVEIARAASVALPTAPDHLAPTLRKRLGGARFNLVVDALDEAVNPEQARMLIDDVLLPLADASARVVVGTRRTDEKGDLVNRFGAASVLINLDIPAYFSETDLADYACATLRLEGAEPRPDNPYANEAVARPVARRIAALAERNFLVAGLVAGVHGNFDVHPVKPEAISFTPTVGFALNTYVYKLPPIGAVPASLALTVLAHAEAPGLSLPLWRAGISAFGSKVTEDRLQAFARGSAANFLVEVGTETVPAYRLFHQALNEALLSAHRTDTERRLVAAWLRHGAEHGWADPYLTRRLPAHAERGACVDLLFDDVGYLLHADLRPLLLVSEHAQQALSKTRVKLLQRTPQAVGVDGPRRSAMFSIVERLDQLDSRMPVHPDVPYWSDWAHTPPRPERAVLEGHTKGVFGVCALKVHGRSLLASAGGDATTRIWDPATGQTEHVLDQHAEVVRAVCGVRVEGEQLLAAAGQDKTVLLWNPLTGKLKRRLLSPRPKERPYSHGDWVRALCAVEVGGGRDLLASASDDRVVRLWDPATGDCVRELRGHSGWVTTVCSVPARTGALLASAGYDGAVKLWDPHSEKPVAEFAGHVGWVTAVCAVECNKRWLLASAGYDDLVRLWDPVACEQVRTIDTVSSPVTGLCAVEVGGLMLLVVTGEDGRIHLYDPSTDGSHRTLGLHDDTLHTERVRGVCSVSVGTRPLLASASDDGTVRLWDPSTGRAGKAMGGGRIGPVTSMCTVHALRVSERAAASGGRGAVATTAPDGAVRLWDAATGSQIAKPFTHSRGVTDVCTVAVEGDRLLAVATGDPEVRLWDLQTGESRRVFDAGAVVNVVVPVSIGRRELLAMAGEDELIRLWNPLSGGQDVVLNGLMNSMFTALCPLPGDGGYDLLASATDDGTVQLWDPGEGSLVWTRHGHAEKVTALRTVTVAGRLLLASTSTDRSIRLWDPAFGLPVEPTLRGHTMAVNDVCAMPTENGDLLVSASDDRTVRVWDPATAAVVQSIPVQHRALSCRWVSCRLIIGLDTGLLALSTRENS